MGQSHGEREMGFCLCNQFSSFSLFVAGLRMGQGGCFMIGQRLFFKENEKSVRRFFSHVCCVIICVVEMFCVVFEKLKFSDQTKIKIDYVAFHGFLK